MRLVEAHVMMCIAGDFNGDVGTAETGEEDSFRRIQMGNKEL